MSIAYFPEIYPDELLYSVLARFYLHSGYPIYILVAEKLFINKRVKPDIEFINEIKPEVMQLLCRGVSREQLIEKHTLFPYYGRFLPKERRNKAFKALCNMAGDYNNLLAVPKRKNGEQRYLRYCCLCVERDRKVYGETYWHRSHQLMEVDFCPEHGCKLENSTVLISGSASPSLVAAELEIHELGTVIYGTEVEQQLVKYVGAVFQADVDMKSDVGIGKFLHSRLYGTKYVSVRGEQRNIEVFANDFISFYKELTEQGLSEVWQMQKVFNGYRVKCFDVCQMALFLNVSVEDLCNIKLPVKSQEQIFDEKVKELHKQGVKYPEIARRLNASYDMVKSIGGGRYGKYTYKKETHQKGGAKPLNWEKIDKETLPLVKKAIKELQGKVGDRPHRVNVYAVSKKLGLPDGRLKFLPKCMKEILKYKETQEQYWAREIVWAVVQIQRDGVTLNWKQIRVLTNMRKDNLIASLPHLKEIEPELAEVVESLL